MTNLSGLYDAFVNRFPKLDTNGKIFFDHIIVQEGDEVVPPYVVFRTESLNPFYADNTLYFATVNNYIDVYSETAAEGLHKQIEALLTSLEITFTSTGGWDDSYGMYMTEYTVSLSSDDEES